VRLETWGCRPADVNDLNQILSIGVEMHVTGPT
jgi:hypothetical protein